ncbi:hypothetical protein V3C99_000455 [Haemonchus contortus]
MPLQLSDSSIRTGSSILSRNPCVRMVTAIALRFCLPKTSPFCPTRGDNADCMLVMPVPLAGIWGAPRSRIPCEIGEPVDTYRQASRQRSILGS